MIGAPLAWVPIAKPCGDLFHYLLRDVLPNAAAETVWENGITSLFIALALLFGLRLSFEKLEKQQIIICSILVTGTIIGTLMVRPDFGQALVGSLSLGRLPEFPAWAPADAQQNPLLTMATAFAYVGGSVMGYIVYANWIGIHRWGMTGHEKIDAIRSHAFRNDQIDYLPDDPSQVKQMRKIIAPLRWDVSIGALVLFIVTGAFMLSGAAVLYPLKTEFKGWSLLTEQAHVWSTIHVYLGVLYLYHCGLVGHTPGLTRNLRPGDARILSSHLAASRVELPYHSTSRVALYFCYHNGQCLVEHPFRYFDPNRRIYPV